LIFALLHDLKKKLTDAIVLNGEDFEYRWSLLVTAGCKLIQRAD
jgi:hypothetical protein